MGMVSHVSHSVHVYHPKEHIYTKGGARIVEESPERWG
jgi:hypothetical protein